MYQLSRMCREKGAVKHDDRVDALSQGVQWFIDALALSASRQQSQRKSEEFKAMQQMFVEDPQRATDALALGMGFHELSSRKTTRVYDWA